MTFLAGLGLGVLITIGTAFIAAVDRDDNKKKDVDEEDDIWYT